MSWENSKCTKYKTKVTTTRLHIYWDITKHDHSSEPNGKTTLYKKRVQGDTYNWKNSNAFCCNHSVWQNNMNKRRQKSGPKLFSVILRSKKQFQLLHIEVITKYHLGNLKKNNVRSWMNSIGLQHVRVTLNKQILPSWMRGRQVVYRDVMLQNPETISFAKKVKLPNHQFDAIVIRIMQNTFQFSNESIFINFISAWEFNSISSHGFYVQVKEVLWLH